MPGLGWAGLGRRVRGVVLYGHGRLAGCWRTRKLEFFHADIFTKIQIYVSTYRDIQ